MLAIRKYSSESIDPLKRLAMSYTGKGRRNGTPELKLQAFESDETGSIIYPLHDSDRVAFRSEDGKKVTPYQWKLYDFIKTIPEGRVMTYKTVAEAIGGSPRSVGGGLRHNPFAPYIPCHRVIATDLFIGGFMGEWGTDGGTGNKVPRKVALLQSEGLEFDANNKLVDRSKLWLLYI